jgi:hypothetical protein
VSSRDLAPGNVSDLRAKDLWLTTTPWRDNGLATFQMVLTRNSGTRHFLWDTFSALGEHTFPKSSTTRPRWMWSVVNSILNAVNHLKTM